MPIVETPGAISAARYGSGAGTAITNRGRSPLDGKECKNLPVKEHDPKEAAYVLTLLIRQGFATGNMTLECQWYPD